MHTYKKIFFLIILLFTIISGHSKQPETTAELIQPYYERLPKIECSENITDFLLKFHPKDSLSLIGIEDLTNKIDTQMSEAAPLQFLLIGFPSKSTNKEKKVIGDHIDLGEYAALCTLDYICNQIATLYPPGAHITLISDGIPYAPVLEIDDAAVETYAAEMKNLIDSHFHHLSFYQLNEIPDTPTFGMSPKEVRHYLEAKFLNVDATQESEETASDMSGYMKSELDCSLWKQRFEDEAIFQIPALPEEQAKDKKRVAQYKQSINEKKNLIATKKITELVKTMSNGSKAVGAYLEQTLPHYETSYIRLSVHTHENVGKKLAISLIYKSRGTPWQKAPVVTSTGIEFVDRSTASKKKLALVENSIAYYDARYNP